MRRRALQPCRRRLCVDLLRLLAGAGEGGLAAGEIAEALHVAPSTLSFHFAALEHAGLLRSERQGRRVIYSARLSGLRGLFEFLTETCFAGRPELRAEIGRLLPDRTSEEASMEAAYNILFICTRNSARSIMAEAILGTVGRGKFNAYSAGSSPPRHRCPKSSTGSGSSATTSRGLRSKSWNEFTEPIAPRAWISSSRSATRARARRAPISASSRSRRRGRFPIRPSSPARTSSALTLLNELYGMIRRRLEIFINLPFASLDRMALKARLDELGDSHARADAADQLGEQTTMKVGINGMGRMGRLALRAAMGGVLRADGDPRGSNRLDVVHVNEIKGGAAATAHLLEFDSMHGRWRTPIETRGRDDASRSTASVSASREGQTPGDVPWGDLGCDIVLECTGKFLKPARARRPTSSAA